MDRLSAARRETIRYHESFYATTLLGTPGSWLAQPHPSVVEAIELVEANGPVRAFDLGAGVGRHTVPMAQILPAGSTITAVDLLPTAIQLLIDNCRTAGVLASVNPVVADLEQFEFGNQPASLIIGFSVVEHLNSFAAMRRLLTQCRDASGPSGIVSFGIVADRCEVASDGTVGRGLVETHVSAEQTLACLMSTFVDWAVLRAETEGLSVSEDRDGLPYTLCGSLVIFTARKTSGAPAS